MVAREKRKGEVMNKERREERIISEDKNTCSLLSPLRSTDMMTKQKNRKSSPCPNHVLVSHTEEVPLLVGQLSPGLGDGLHGGRHVIVPLGLLGQLGALNQFVLLHC